MLAFWIIGYAWKRTLPKAISEIDLDVSTVLLKRLLVLTSSHLVWPQELAYC